MATGESNLFNYPGLPNTNRAVDHAGGGLDHGGCGYTTTGRPYPDRNQFYGAGLWNADMNFDKNFKLSQRFHLQFRNELYNLFKHPNQYILGAQSRRLFVGDALPSDGKRAVSTAMPDSRAMNAATSSSV